MICEDVELMPRRATRNSAGYDVYAMQDMVVTTRPKTFDLGFRFEDGDMPAMAGALLMPRSSTGNNKGLHLRGTLGLIDSDYRENVRATLCVDEGTAVFKRGDRILQFFIVSTLRVPGEIEPIEERNGGYGSTGE